MPAPATQTPEVGPAATIVAFFDLDNTLIAGDSDYLWGEYLADVGAVPAAEHRRQNQRFMEAYRRGRLDPAEFLRFQLAPLALHATETLLRWRSDFLERRIRPLLLSRAQALIDRHRRLGHVIAIATSTNSFITRPIADLLEVEHLLATEPEQMGERFTGRVSGVPCFAQGKVYRARAFADAQGARLADCWFYSDSHTDIALLEAVGHPHAVDPDHRLERLARARQWPVLSLR